METEKEEKPEVWVITTDGGVPVAISAWGEDAAWEALQYQHTSHHIGILKQSGWSCKPAKIKFLFPKVAS